MARSNQATVILVGPMGVGKSTIGKHLAEQLKLEFIDTDNEIEQRCGTSISWIFDIEGEEGFRKREEKVIHELTENPGVVLATGGGCVESGINRARLSARGVVIYLQATIEQQIERTIYDKKRPLLQVDDKKAKIEHLDKLRRPLYEGVADYTVVTDGSSIRSVVTQIIRHIREEDA